MTFGQFPRSAQKGRELINWETGKGRWGDRGKEGREKKGGERETRRRDSPSERKLTKVISTQYFIFLC